MRRLVIISFICLSALAAVRAQQPDTLNLESLYISAPLEICASLTPQQRFELIENAKIGRNDTITNFLRGKAWIEKIDLSSRYLLIHQTEHSSLEILIKDGKIFTIRTYYAPLASSYCSIYSPDWVEQQGFLFTMPDCHNMPAIHVKAQIQGDSILLENQSLDEIFEIHETQYRDCPRYQTIPLSL